MSKIIKKAIIAVVVIILIAVLWSAFSKKKDDTAGLTVTEGEGSASPLSGDEIVEDTFLGTLLNISQITLNDSVFADPRFVSLEDFTVTLIPQAVGRTNPFLPSGATALPETTVTTTTGTSSTNTTIPE